MVSGHEDRLVVCYIIVYSKMEIVSKKVAIRLIPDTNIKNHVLHLFSIVSNMFSRCSPYVPHMFSMCSPCFQTVFPFCSPSLLNSCSIVYLCALPTAYTISLYAIHISQYVPNMLSAVAQYVCPCILPIVQPFLRSHQHVPHLFLIFANLFSACSQYFSICSP